MRMKQDNALLDIISRFEQGWRKQANEAIKRLYELLQSGMKVEIAVNQLRKEYVDLFRLKGIEDAVIEAAAYGYGVMPKVLVEADRNAIAEAVEQPWSADGMKLSEKLHSTDRAIHRAIQDTVQFQVNNNSSVMEIVRELYDGYNSGKAVVQRPETLPRYMHRITRKLGTTRNESREIERALKKVDELAQNGAPNKALKTAYNELVNAIESGSDKALRRAVATALEEKARYIAERIARTETARAYADGFLSRYDNDPDVVAYEFKLSTRHPDIDICDMYADCDMFNLGKGVYPKDQIPLIPLHPHCLCRYVAVYKPKNQPKNQREKAVREWLEKLSETERKRVLGKQGAEAFDKNQKWENESKNLILGKQESRIVKALASQMYNGVVSEEIDKWTACLVENATGQEVSTEFEKLKRTDISKLKGWFFTWTKPFDDGYEVFALKVKGNKDIQGLLSVKYNDREKFVEIGNIESAPQNSKYNKSKPGKKYVGVGAHLIAEGVKICYNRYAKETGDWSNVAVSFISKTNLIDYYTEKIGAVRYGKNLMVLEGEGARKLYEHYYHE